MKPCDMPEVLQAIEDSGLSAEEVVKYIKHGREMEKLISRAYYWQAETLQECQPRDIAITGELFTMMHKLEA
jgi:hypothetical protein